MQKSRFLNVFISFVMSLFALLSTTTHAQNSDLKQIFTQLSASSVVRANFVQHKKLASLNKTYVSKGTVVFTKNSGVLWQIQSPVKADLIVTPKKIVQKTQRTYSQIEVDKTPYGSVATMFLQLMSGNETALAKNFNVVSANYSPTKWNVSLTPKSGLFKKLFVKVDAQGQRYVDQIVIQEQANNSTTIRFSQQTAQPQTLTAAENALFQLAK
ncbi:outer membrane lipoprotein carrier protein LolA [Acinetobacter portensis]|uniref:Outer membrane lipoprotein carrier protein LolA n=3 Tax=Moraxellaceae TaxID=468 RepID=A0ABU5GGU5_9GAMM|nr:MULTISPECIES: outer membrane lipoprotein carrier protein LolA [Acinetobacter]MCK7608020.1 outer membrane lipoprotein carrier protein LolA [Acinetobacter portensis]MCK7638842.1 outer membrane lipoprotein carrier protein LolA [Acinetobacter portensis]MDY6488882.1 outer membrane lipoprotein carrier protein LolA [Acinetobacter faecalis]MDY6509593.1 outer membrane lipoprotein carrier protein LolA [Acinetobacter faecalis]MDY6549732.1 outer membrane lipoprotein carrier protein LolA [Acinetobacter 